MDLLKDVKIKLCVINHPSHDLGGFSFFFFFLLLLIWTSVINGGCIWFLLCKREIKIKGKNWKEEGVAEVLRRGNK